MTYRLAYLVSGNDGDVRSVAVYEGDYEPECYWAARQLKAANPNAFDNAFVSTWDDGHEVSSVPAREWSELGTA